MRIKSTLTTVSKTKYVGKALVFVRGISPRSSRAERDFNSRYALAVRFGALDPEGNLSGNEQH